MIAAVSPSGTPAAKLEATVAAEHAITITDPPLEEVIASGSTSLGG